MNLLLHLLKITQAIFILLGFLSFSVYGSNIAAGNNLIIRATGDGTKGADGNAIVAGFIEGLVYSLEKTPVLWGEIDAFLLPITKEIIKKQRV